MNSIQKGFASYCRPLVDRPPKRSERALSLFSLHSPPPQNQSIFYGSLHSLGEVFCYFYKSNAFSFFGGAKKESAIAWSRGSALFWSLRPKFTPCDRVRSPDHRSGQKKSRPNLDQKSGGSNRHFFDQDGLRPCAQSAPKPAYANFFEPQKNMLRSLQHAKATKRRAKILS